MYGSARSSSTPEAAGFDASPGPVQDRGMDDRIIDLGEYIRKREEREEGSSRRAFAVWGGEGERSRFALSLWRAAYLSGGSRAALVWERSGSTERRMRPFMVLDLAVEPARTDIPGEVVEGLRNEPEAPAVGGRQGREVVVFLGERANRRWYLVVTDLDEDAKPLEGTNREDVLFLAGECAGLLFHRRFAFSDPDE